jgi:hypothetical protein
MIPVEFTGNNPVITGFIHLKINWYYEQAKQGDQ